MACPTSPTLGIAPDLPAPRQLANLLRFCKGELSWAAESLNQPPQSEPANFCEGRMSCRRDGSAVRSETCHQFRRRYWRLLSSELTLVFAQRVLRLRAELLVLLVVDPASVLVGFFHPAETKPRYDRQNLLSSVEASRARPPRRGRRERRNPR
jgi:hypothetical protein